MAILAGPVLLALAQQAAAADAAGVRRIEIPSTARDRPLNVTVWYPASVGGEAVMLGESPFFVGTSAMLDAPVLEHRYPLVLLSHGAGLAGSAEAMSWIAAPLAKRGFVVAAPTHPGNIGLHRSAAETMKLWLRPADVSQTLDAMEKTSFFKEHIEPGEVGVLGLSMGGSTALALAGARFDPQRLAAYCDTDALNPSLCGWLRQSGVDLRAMDMKEADRDNRDARIRFAMAIDPAPVDVFDSRTFSQIEIPVEIVNLGRTGEIPVSAQAADVAKAIPGARYIEIKDASHFSMFAECKPGAMELAETEKIEEPICSDGYGQSRRAIHAQLIDLVARAFRRTLRSDH
ncbi:alpha/beta hydrolase family protein [Microvirga rosea]|uniref:alpha/beta hydrolase family protein n=1 Tax=Microvirga rosea TaxID=2715425 RepID=UPI001D0A311A|nr:alpha/beta fold hydrolase [Microvirga rosea]MCB8823427.1 dienelactone hydrolase [Microvirga rosea]